MNLQAFATRQRSFVRQDFALARATKIAARMAPSATVAVFQHIDSRRFTALAYVEQEKMQEGIFLAHNGVPATAWEDTGLSR